MEPTLVLGTGRAALDAWTVALTTLALAGMAIAAAILARRHRRRAHRAGATASAPHGEPHPYREGEVAQPVPDAWHLQRARAHRVWMWLHLVALLFAQGVFARYYLLLLRGVHVDARGEWLESRQHDRGTHRSRSGPRYVWTYVVHASHRDGTGHLRPLSGNVDRNDPFMRGRRVEERGYRSGPQALAGRPVRFLVARGWPSIYTLGDRPTLSDGDGPGAAALTTLLLLLAYPIWLRVT